MKYLQKKLMKFNINSIKRRKCILQRNCKDFHKCKRNPLKLYLNLFRKKAFNLTLLLVPLLQK